LFQDQIDQMQVYNRQLTKLSAVALTKLKFQKKPQNGDGLICTFWDGSLNLFTESYRALKMPIC
jgi:hypothetical protein